MRVFVEYQGKLYEWKEVKGGTCEVCAMRNKARRCPNKMGSICTHLRRYVGDVGGKYTHRFQEVPV